MTSPFYKSMMEGHRFSSNVQDERNRPPQFTATRARGNLIAGKLERNELNSRNIGKVAHNMVRTRLRKKYER